MKPAILLAITAYQRYLSPYKGFHCAFARHTGRDTCSGYGYRVFARYGTRRGYLLLRRRFAACSNVACQHARQAPVSQGGLALRQGGFIDCGGCDLPNCDNCDVSSCKGSACDVLGNTCDLLQLGENCGGDRRSRKSCRDWDCADWLSLLAVLALIVAALFLVYYFWPKT